MKCSTIKELDLNDNETLALSDISSSSFSRYVDEWDQIYNHKPVHSGTHNLMNIFNETQQMVAFLPACVFFNLGFYLEKKHYGGFKNGKNCCCPMYNRRS